MSGDPEIDKLDEMAARIRKAEQKPVTTPTGSPSGTMKISRVGFDFVATILGSLFLGWAIDKELNTGPWGIVGMMFVGFAIGLMRVWRSQQSE